MSSLPNKADALATRLAGRIDAGIFPAGTKLPSLRHLARTEGCSISTVVAAMETLASRGMTISLPRSGIFVASVETSTRSTFRATPRSLDVVRSRSHGLSRRILEMAHDHSLAPFHAAIPHPSLLPLASIGGHLHASLAKGARHLGSYSPPAGSFALRRELSRTLPCTDRDLHPSDLVLTNGCMEALALGIEACSDQEAIVAVESPTFFGLVSLLESMGRKVVEVPCAPGTGLRLDLLETSLDKHAVSALVVSPDVQNPTGACMDLQSRHRLVALARARNLTLIEDAVYSLCLFGDRRLPSLASLWREGVIHCCSASKILAPGLRIGWMEPGSWMERVIALKSTRTFGGPMALQDALAGFLASPAWPRHQRRFRRTLLEQVQSTRQRILEFFPAGTRISQPQGGFFLWVEVPGLDSLDLFERSLEKGIGLLPGPVFSAHPDRFRNCIRLSCGTPLDAALDGKLRELGGLAAASIRTARS